ncbi:hypothetical protein GCM10010451_39830 [Streptomyces virens]|uniref:Uncharacterized protein n=1 Tax=Streptomyces virens TaxID=285572 RepID=A0ABP6PTT7_9ACTN
MSGLTDDAAGAIGRQAANLDPNPYHRRAQDYADLIADVLREAAEADERWAPKLRALKADDDLTVSDKDWADATQAARASRCPMPGSWTSRRDMYGTRKPTAMSFQTSVVSATAGTAGLSPAIRVSAPTR